MKLNRNDLNRFHEFGVLVAPRVVYFGSDIHVETGAENGVDFVSARKLIKNLLFLDTISRRLITLYINTPGGCEFNGMAIYDTIRRIKSPVKAIGIGQVMSMGTIIIQACKYRYLTKECTFMIHDGTFGMESDSKSFEEWGKWSKKFRERMYKIYLEKIKEKKSRLTYAQVEELCKHDRIMSAKEAVKIGLGDKVI